MNENNSVTQLPSHFRTSQTHPESQASELLQEVKDLYDQYQKEVPGKRRQWPESIRTRILTLWSLGVKTHQIGQDTHIPIQTLYSWRQKIKEQEPSGGFSGVPVVTQKRRTKFQIQEDERRKSSLQLSQLKASPTTDSKQASLITIALPNGIKIEGVSIEHLAEVLYQVGSA